MNKVKEVYYEITTDPHFQDKEHYITKALSDQLEELYYEANDKNNKKVINKLEELVLKFPKTPILKNYLSVAYNTKGLYEKSIEINKQILVAHPGYLFGRLNLANHYLLKNDFTKVDEMLGKEMEIQFLFPERNVFHLAEVRSLLSFAVRYFIEKDDIDAAEIRYEMLEDLDPDHPDTDTASNLLMFYRLKKGAERWEKEKQEAIEVVADKHPPKSSEKNPPAFNHPIIAELYKYHHEINQSIIKEILALPRETLVADLETVLKDTVKRYHYFVNDEAEETVYYFPIHALLLLAELKSGSSLPIILEVLSYDSEFIDFWYDGFNTEDLWMVFYKLSDNNLDTLKNLLLTPAIDTYIKSSVATTLLQLFLNDQLTKEELASIYKTIYEGFLIADIDSNLIDSDVMAFMICETIDGGLKELLPIIKQLFDKGYVSIGICGDYNDVAEEIGSKPNYKEKKDIFNIFEYYDDVIDSWVKHEERNKLIQERNNRLEYNKYSGSTYKFKEPSVPLVSNKIGRNDPCPCGSGKKYKKCCLE